MPTIRHQQTIGPTALVWEIEYSREDGGYVIHDATLLGFAHGLTPYSDDDMRPGRARNDTREALEALSELFADRVRSNPRVIDEVHEVEMGLDSCDARDRDVTL